MFFPLPQFPYHQHFCLAAFPTVAILPSATMGVIMTDLGDDFYTRAFAFYYHQSFLPAGDFLLIGVVVEPYVGGRHWWN